MRRRVSEVFGVLSMRRRSFGYEEEEMGCTVGGLGDKSSGGGVYLIALHWAAQWWNYGIPAMT